MDLTAGLNLWIKIVTILAIITAIVICTVGIGIGYLIGAW